VFGILHAKPASFARWAAEYRGTCQHWPRDLRYRPGIRHRRPNERSLRSYLGPAVALPINALPLLLGPAHPGPHRCLFLGLLEMARANEIGLELPEGWEEIWETGVASRTFRTASRLAIQLNLTPITS